MSENLRQRRYRDNRERIERNIIIAPSGCWVWLRHRDRGGYGSIAVPGPDGKLHNTCAHRVSYEVFVGSIPNGFEIDHLCRVRHCVNPRHLQAVTPRVNTLRGWTLPAKNVVKTHCPAGHPYAGHNLRIRPANGNRRCAACYAERSRRASRARRIADEKEARR